MMNQIKIIFLLFILFGFRAFAADPCDGLAISYQPALILMAQENDLPQRLTVTRTETTGSCSFSIFIENVPGATDTTRFLKQGNNQIPIQFYTTAGHAQIVRSAAGASSPADGLSGVLTEPSTSMDLYYYPYIDLAVVNVPANAPYTNGYDFSLYTWPTNGNKKKEKTNAGTNYKYQLGYNLSLSLVNDGSPYNAADVAQTLNFGPLTSGVVRGFDLWLVYSDGYKLSLISTNGGNLKNTAVTSNNLVPYTLSFDNINVPLSSTETVVKTGTGVSPVGGTKIDVTATIGNFGTVYAGTYNDYVTFRIAAP